MLGSARVYAEANQATILTPFILAGAMAPVTVAGTAAQTLAEALAGIAFTQIVKPGAPVVLGSFASSMSMQSGAPTFGTPEPALVLWVMAALARRLGVPFRSGGNLTSSKVPDAQAAYESAATFFPTMTAGVNFVLHTAGWLEGGLVMGYEKFVLDADMAGMASALVAGVDLSDNGQAMEPILATGPGQHYLGTEHTLANFETAFWRAETPDSNSFEQWESEGAKDAVTRAHERWREMISDSELPPLDDAVDHELQTWVQTRKDSFPDSDVS
jgi:trimethylamine--corrinoid protein Co-methyltransferase